MLNRSLSGSLDAVLIIMKGSQVGCCQLHDRVALFLDGSIKSSKRKLLRKKQKKSATAFCGWSKLHQPTQKSM